MSIRAKHISMRYKKNSRVILDDFNLKADKGDFIACVGESGSGKSTLLAILAGILKPANGTVLFEDKNIYELGDEEISKLHHENISYVPQGNTMLKRYSVIENIVLPHKLAGSVGDSIYEKAERYLEDLGILELKDRFPYELSGGELKRVALIRALLLKPNVVIADEPTTGIDKKTGKVILSYLQRYANDGNVVIVATHDEKIYEYTDKIIEMS